VDALVNTIINIWFPQNAWKFLSSWATGGFSRTPWSYISMHMPILGIDSSYVQIPLEALMSVCVYSVCTVLRACSDLATV
jgi:hypothetical protein